MSGQYASYWNAFLFTSVIYYAIANAIFSMGNMKRNRNSKMGAQPILERNDNHNPIINSRCEWTLKASSHGTILSECDCIFLHVKLFTQCECDFYRYILDSHITIAQNGHGTHSCLTSHTEMPRTQSKSHHVNTSLNLHTINRNHKQKKKTHHVNEF